MSSVKKISSFDPVEKLRAAFTKCKKFFWEETARVLLGFWLQFLRIRLKLDNFIVRLGGSSLRKNIESFPKNAEYWSYASFRFQTKSVLVKPVDALVEFKNGRMSWSYDDDREAIATLEFADGAALVNYLLSFTSSWFQYLKNDFALNNRDVLERMLDNEITLRGNLNYLFKLSFIVNHNILDFSGKLPR